MPIFDYNPLFGVDPEGQRASARSAKYANTDEERAEIARVDDVIFDRVREYERGAVLSGQEIVDRSRVEVQNVTSITHDLGIDVIEVLSRTQDIESITAVAQRYKQIRGAAIAQIAALERLAREAEWAASRAEDPYAGYRALVLRYPALSKSA